MESREHSILIRFGVNVSTFAGFCHFSVVISNRPSLKSAQPGLSQLREGIFERSFIIDVHLIPSWKSRKGLAIFEKAAEHGVPRFCKFPMNGHCWIRVFIVRGFFLSTRCIHINMSIDQYLIICPNIAMESKCLNVLR